MFEFELDQTVYYLMDNRVCSGPVLCRMLVENLHPTYHTAELYDTYLRFGPGRAEYATCDGELAEREMFESREALSVAILEGRI